LTQKIFVITSEYDPMPAAAASRISPWVGVLRDAGYETRIFTSSSVDSSCSSVTKSFWATPSNKAFLPIRLFQEILLGFDIGVMIWMNRKRCIGCIVTSPPFFMACICVFFARLSQIPYLFDVRDRYPRVLMDLGIIGSSNWFYRVLEWMEGWIYKGAKKITSVTEGLVTELRTGFAPKKFHLLRNGFDESIFTRELIETKKRKAFTVVYHGRLGRFYDLDTYLEIIKIVYKADSSIRFLMVGELPSSISSNAPPNLEILPAMKLENLSKVLSSCHLGICLLRDLPAMKNAFPAKAYDYIGAGIPVLAGPRGELSQIVDRFNIGTTFEKISAKEVADTIVGLKNDSEVWSKMCAQVKKCRVNFGRRNIAREFFSHGLFNQ
jgi:glycosyltransferase involved in cell wall biosynthesis